MGEVNARNASVTIQERGATYTVYPAELLPLSEVYRLDSRASVRRFSTHYACSCPAWRFHKERDVRARTCEHLAEVLGEEYERARLLLARVRRAMLYC